jgi:signal transduction histidine kinase/ActR/RegA family two-component response regulator
MPDQVRPWVAAAADGQTIRQELTLKLPAGERSFDFSLRPIRDMRGEVTAIAPEAVETTERRRTEEALRQAQKMEAVGQLTGGIAHDFNNLLAGIMGSLELLQRRLANGRTDGVERYCAAAITSAQRASALTQRLLAFARRQPLDPKMVDANRLIAGMEDLLRRTLGPGIALEMVLAGGLWPTMSDPNQLESAILNLAINARDAMPEGGSLTIETGNAFLDDSYCRAQADEVRPGQYVQVSVTDTGTGMTPDIIAKAFDPFFTTKPTGQGTGLGLSMVYGFVKQSDGHVRIYSETGGGTTFKIYLPRFRGRADDAESGMAGNASDEFRAEAGETVLVVDDEPTVRMLVMETLEELGYQAIEANDGPAGLAVLQTEARIDLLVTDVGLPGLNGRQLADAARVTRPGLKVLFMTGYAHNAAIGQGAALEPGMEIMTKPFALDDLAKKIRDMIEAG